MSGRLAGKRILVLARLSGDKQIGNYSEDEQLDGLIRFVKAEGGTPIPLYENGTPPPSTEEDRRRGVSGQDLAHRKVASEALERIEAGEAEGIGWYDYKRLSRNRFLEDQGQIQRRMAAERAVIVVLGQIIRPWIPAERKQFQVMAAATEDGSDLRDTFYRGQFGRAKREAFVKGTPPIGFTTLPVEVLTGAVPKVKRVPAKDPRYAAFMADLRAWYGGCRTYGEVAGRVNAKYSALLGQAGRRRRKHTTDAGHAIWTDYQAQLPLKNPRYAGFWGFGLTAKKSEMWETDTRRERADEYRHYLPDLAYWTLAEAEAWRARFGDHTHGGRRTRARTEGPDGIKRPPPLTGVLACAGCGERLVGYGSRRYGCPLRTSGRCERPQIIREASALRMLDTIVEEALGRARGLAERLRGQGTKARGKTTEAERTLRVLEEQLQSDFERWYPAGGAPKRIPDQVVTRMSELQVAIDRQRERVARERETRERVDTYLEREARWLAGSLEEQAAAFRSAPPEVLPGLWAEFVTGVRIEATGQGRGRTWRVLPGWEIVRDPGLPGGGAVVDTASTSRYGSAIYRLPGPVLDLLAPAGGGGGSRSRPG